MPPTLPLVQFKEQKKIGKNLDQFDAEPISKKLGIFLSSHPACIKLFQYLVKTRGFAETEYVVAFLRDWYKKAKFKSFVVERKCTSCGLSSFQSLAEVNFNESRRKRDDPCPKCRTSRYIVEEEQKEFQRRDIWSIYLYGWRLGIFSPVHYAVCPFCKYEQDLGKIKKRVNKLFCIKCKKPADVVLCFRIHKKIMESMDIANAHGYWFEWYVTYLIKTSGKNIDVKRNQVFTVDGKEAEIDAVLEKNKQRILLNCSAETDGTFDVEKFHVCNRVGNKIILATPNDTIKSNVVESAENAFPDGVYVKVISSLSDLLFGVTFSKPTKRN